MPSRPAVAPGGRPAWLAGFGRFPQHEIKRITLVFIHIHTRTGAQVLQLLAGQLSVVLEAADRIIDITVFTLVGITFLQQGPDHGQDVIHRLGGAWFKIRPQHAQCVSILVHRGNKTFGERLDALTIFLRTLNNLVINISNITHVCHFIAKTAQVPDDHVKHHQHASMAEVAQVIDRHAAYVHTHLARLDRHKFFFPACPGVEQFQHASGLRWHCRAVRVSAQTVYRAARSTGAGRRAC